MLTNTPVASATHARSHQQNRHTTLLPTIPAHFRFAPEFRLLAACSWLAPPYIQRPQSAQVAKLCSEGIAWDKFLSLVQRHDVPSLAYKALRHSANNMIPSHVMIQLRDLSASSSALALRSSAELVRLGKSFTEQGIAILPLKGVLLSLRLFGDPGTRHPGDLDLLVKPEDLDRANDLLESLGYTCSIPRPRLTTRMKALLRAHTYELSYWHPRLKLLVDIHWGLELWSAAQVAEIWNHCQTTEWMGVTFQHLAEDALLLFLCDHGAKHKWSRMKWLSDVAALLVRPRNAPWSQLLELARRFDLEQPLTEAALLVHWLYGIDIPVPFCDFVSRHAVSADLASESIEAMLMTQEQLFAHASSPGIWSNLRRALRRRKNLSLKLLLLRVLIQEEDLNHFPLPDSCLWLYYPLRPLFWVLRRYRGTPTASNPVTVKS